MTLIESQPLNGASLTRLAQLVRAYNANVDWVYKIARHTCQNNLPCSGCVEAATSYVLSAALAK